MADYRAYIVGIDSPFDSVRTEFLHNHPDDATAIEAAIFFKKLSVRLRSANKVPMQSNACVSAAVRNSLTVVRHDSEIVIERNRHRKD